MSVYISHAGIILSVPTEDDLTPEQLCGDDCRGCLASGTNECPVRMRQFELMADGWMLERLEVRRV